MIMIARSIGLICIMFTIPRRPHPWRNTFYQSLRSFKLVKSSSLWFHQFHTTIPSKCATTAAGSHEGGAELNFGARWCWEIRILGIEDSKTLAHKTMMTFLKIPRVNPVDKFQLPSEAAATDKHQSCPKFSISFVCFTDHLATSCNLSIIQTALGMLSLLWRSASCQWHAPRTCRSWWSQPTTKRTSADQWIGLTGGWAFKLPDGSWGYLKFVDS